MHAKAQIQDAVETAPTEGQPSLSRLAVGPYNGDALAIDGLTRLQSLSPTFTQSLVDYFVDLSALRKLPKIRKRRR